MFANAVLALGLLSSFALAQKCYSLDGQELGDTYKPCNPTAKFSACCALNGTDGNNDICLDSGLCQSTSGWYAGFIWANGCTDQTGKADACPQVCAGKPEQYSFNVLQCNPGSFCCRAGSDQTNCCGTTSALVNTSHIGSLLFPGTDNVVNTTYFAQGSASSASSTPSASAYLSCPVDHTAAVGGALGGVLAAVLLAAAVGFFLLLGSRKSLKSEVQNVKGQRDAALQTSADEKAHLQQQYQQQLMQQQHQQQQQHQMMAAPMYQANPQMYQPSGAFGGSFTPGPPLRTSPPSHPVTPYSGTTAEIGTEARPVEIDTMRNPSELSDGVDRKPLISPSENSY